MIRTMMIRYVMIINDEIQWQHGDDDNDHDDWINY